MRRIALGGEVEQDRRFVGVGGRVDPGVEPRGRRGPAAAPIEGGGDPAIALRPGDQPGGDQGDQHGETQGARVAPRHARRRLGGRESFELAGEAVAMQRPQRLGGGVVARHRQPVVERSGGPVRRAGIAIKPGERLGAGRPPKPRHGEQRDDESQSERGDAADSRQGAAPPARDRARTA